MSLSTGFSPKPLGMILRRRRSSTNSREPAAPNSPPPLPPSAPCRSDNRCDSRSSRRRRARNARAPERRRPRLRGPPRRSAAAQDAPSRSARRGPVPSSPFIKARSSSRAREGADSLSIAMLPGALGANRKPALPVAIQAGCIPTPFSSKPTPSPSCFLGTSGAIRTVIRLSHTPFGLGGSSVRLRARIPTGAFHSPCF
jgi:hypothetical protein